MSAWLYQMREQSDWSVADYRLEVWEGSTVGWPTRRVVGGSRTAIAAGDLIVFVFTPSGNQEPGIYGWGVITRFLDRREEIEFEVVAPSNYLKMDPVWDANVMTAFDVVRGAVKQGTMWRIEPSEPAAFRVAIRRRLGAAT